MPEDKKIEAYGRNGYFQLDFMEVGNRGDAFLVHFFSKIRTRKGYNTSPPIQFIGYKKNLIKLFKDVVKELEALGGGK